MQAGIDQMDNFDLVDTNDSVLMNPDILDQVFSHLDVTTLKSTRLVCTDWADVGAKILGKRGRLTFSTMPNPDCTELTFFNHKLARNVTLQMKCNCTEDKPCECCPTQIECHRNLPPNFAILLPEICGKLDTLTLNTERTINPPQHEIWGAYHFPNLSRISITVTTIQYQRDDIDVTPVPQFRPLQNLKSFSFSILPDYAYKYFPGVAFSPLCQKLLNSAPNLEEFSARVNFYPDLTPCRKLKELRFEYYESRDVADVQVDLPEMTRMLKSCRDSLEKLTLGYHYRDDEDEIKLNFDFPNVTHFSIAASEVYKIEDSLNTKNFPKLTHFSIESDCDISEMIAAYHLRHPGITSLEVECGHYSEINDGQDGHAAGKLINLFPGVKEFKLKFRIDNVSRKREVLRFKEMMRSLSDWELTSGQVDIDIARDWKYGGWDKKIIIAVLEGMTGWKGLKNTSLRFCGDNAYRKLKIPDRMKSALVACRSIRNVAMKGFKIDHKTLENLSGFMAENNLPVSITNSE